MHKLLNHKITLIVSVVILLGAIGFGVYKLIPSSQSLTTTEVLRRNISESVSASGKIDSDKHVSLSFGKTGTVASISVKVGDKVKAGQVLATMKAGDLYASLQGAEADVSVQEANLTSLLKGARSEQIAISSQSVQSAKLALDTSLKDASIKASDALRNKLDIVFDNGSTVNPQLRIRTDSTAAEMRIENNRVAATQKVATWTSDVSSAQVTLSFIKSLIDDVLSEIATLDSQNSGYSQATIDSFSLSVNAAAAEVNGAIASLNTANQAYKTSLDQFALTDASSTPEALSAQEALLSRAEASVENVQSQIGNTIITAPFDGVVASIIPKVGEDTVAYTPAIDILNNDTYKIEVYIPESDIAKVSIGSIASVSIDAYGSNNSIPAHVASIDLSQTIQNGVGSYKADVYLDRIDEHVRAGLTGRVTIQGRSASQVVAVPSSSLIKRDAEVFVLARSAENSKSFIETKVETGISGDGFTEIVSGLSEGDEVAMFGNR